MVIVLFSSYEVEEKEDELQIRPQEVLRFIFNY